VDGIINVLKPPGMTSAAVVGWLRKQLHGQKIGHAGTLDPDAVGVLPVCVGKASRLAEYFTAQGKSYRAELTFGLTTTTQDAAGQIIACQEPRLTRADLEAVLPRFLGEIQQLPPMFSAVRHSGRRLYEYARSGIEVERQARTVTVYSLQVVGWREERFPCAVLDVECSKGTYIRTLCHDIGQALGCGGHMSYLLRTRSGPFTLATSWTLEELEAAQAVGDASFLLPLSSGLDLPLVTLPAERARAFCQGLATVASRIPGARVCEGELVQVSDGQNLLGIGVWREQQLRPHKVLTER